MPASNASTVRYLAFIAFCVICAGCADTSKEPTTKPLSADERQKQILADPMHYGADGELNNKNGLSDERPTFKRDVDNFFNP